MANKKKAGDGLDYEVGFGKTPVHSRFQPGQSGNPRGRPKGKCNVATALQAALNECVTITENGRHKTITKLEAAMKRVVNGAVTGDTAAGKLLLPLLHFLDGQPDDQLQQPVSSEARQQMMARLIKRIQGAAASTPSDQSPKKQGKK